MPAIGTDLDSALLTLRARLEWAEANVPIYFSGAAATAAESALRGARRSYDWLAGDGYTAVLDGSIPFERWKVAAEGMADVLTELSMFADRNSFSSFLQDVAVRTGQTISEAAPGKLSLGIVLLIVVGLIILKVA